MKIDFSKCGIIKPEGSRLDSFYKKLWDVFPYDRPIYEILMEKGNFSYPMDTYALYLGDTLLGNSGIFSFDVMVDGERKKIAGIGAVATMPEYRRQGVASHLLKYCLSIVDKTGIDSILFTELSAVYEPFGFESVAQNYMAISAEERKFPNGGLDFRVISELDEKDIGIIDHLYSDDCPPLNGKVFRDKRYWAYYKMMFDPYPKPEIVFCGRNGKETGYARYEVEKDRLTVTEFCCGPERDEIISSLLFFLNRKSLDAGFAMITIALGPDHFIWKFLNDHGIKPFSEAEGVRREIFMLRPGSSRRNYGAEQLFWPLSDKF